MRDKKSSGTVFDIQRSSFVDGPGIRTTIFFKGCNMRCAWCHNPESQSANPEMMIYKNRCTGCGKCKEVCQSKADSCELCGKCVLFCPNDARAIAGKEFTAEDIMREVIKDQAFYNASGGGVTFSGGECMLKIDFLYALLKLCRENRIHTAVDTAGAVPFSYFERILPYVDLFLYDVKMIDSERHKFYTGVDNTLILSNLAKLLCGGARVTVRVPVIEGVNATEDEMLKIKAFIDSNGGAPVELLPYHAMGEHKYSALGKAYESFSAPSEKKLSQLKRIFNDQ